MERGMKSDVTAFSSYITRGSPLLRPERYEQHVCDAVVVRGGSW